MFAKVRRAFFPHKGRIKTVATNIYPACCKDVFPPVFSTYFCGIELQVSKISCTASEIGYKYLFLFTDGLFIGKCSPNGLKLEAYFLKACIFGRLAQPFLGQRIFQGVVIIKKNRSANNSPPAIGTGNFIGPGFQFFQYECYQVGGIEFFMIDPGFHKTASGQDAFDGFHKAALHSIIQIGINCFFAHYVF
ncbi:hypothetical protein D3C86_1523250 [compost metagenome]